MKTNKEKFEALKAIGFYDPPPKKDLEDWAKNATHGWTAQDIEELRSEYALLLSKARSDFVDQK